MSLERVPRASVAAVVLLALDVAVRLVAGGPYLGATFILLAACGISLLPLLPNELGTPSLRLAILPALALGSFAILLTTVSIVGVPLTEVSIRLVVFALIVALAAAARVLGRREARAPAVSWSVKREGIAVAALVAVVAFSLGSSWDIAGSFPPPGADWGHYLLYAEEVEAQGSLLIHDPLAGEEGGIFGDPAGVGAVYGSFLILDGISSRPLASGVVVVSALTPLSVFAAVGGLWGVGAGLLAAGVYAVSPIRLEPMYWHGLGTTLALVFFPLVVLALGLVYRGGRDSRTIALLAFSLVGVGVSHTTSVVVAAILIAVVLVLGVVHWHNARRTGQGRGVLRPVLAGVAMALALGAGVIAHMLLQSAELGPPVSYRLFEPDWLSLRVVVDYYSWPLLVLAALSLVLLLSRRSLRHDRALLAVIALGLASVLVSQLWLIHVPYEYRRAVYYMGVALVMLIGVASLRLPRTAVWIAGYLLVLAYMANSSIGLRLPERLVTGDRRKSGAVEALTELRGQLDRGREPEARLVVADRCLHFVVPYLLRRPTIAAFEDWQAGFSNRVPLARKAVAVLRGGPEGRQLAESLEVDYVVIDPRCTDEPDLGGTVVAKNEVVTIIRLVGD